MVLELNSFLVDCAYYFAFSGSVRTNLFIVLKVEINLHLNYPIMMASYNVRHTYLIRIVDFIRDL